MRVARDVGAKMKIALENLITISAEAYMRSMLCRSQNDDCQSGIMAIAKRHYVESKTKSNP